MVFASLAIVFAGLFLGRVIVGRLTKDERKIVIFGFLFFTISLLPFLGLGNITSRYSYLASVGFAIVFAFFFKKLYYYLLESYDRHIALSSVLAIAILFCVVHLFQLQKIHNDWYASGEKSKRFIVALEEVYVSEWKNERLKLYFVDVPIRFGEAWVFPVGLRDVIWLIFGNDKIDVYQSASLKEALNAIEDPRTEKVFEFDSDGGLTEWRKTSSATIFPVEK